MSSPDQLVDKNPGPTRVIEEALGRAGPGKEQTGDVIQETESGEEIRYSGPSAFDRAKETVSRLAEQAGEAISNFKEKVVPTTGAPKIAESGTVSDPTAKQNPTVAESIDEAKQSAVAELKEGAGAAAASGQS